MENIIFILKYCNTEIVCIAGPLLLFIFQYIVLKMIVFSFFFLREEENNDLILVIISTIEYLVILR